MTCTTCGCLMRAVALASRSKRATSAGSAAARSGRMSFTATSVSRVRCRAAQTTPIPPCPRGRSSRSLAAMTAPGRSSTMALRAYHLRAPRAGNVDAPRCLERGSPRRPSPRRPGINSRDMRGFDGGDPSNPPCAALAHGVMALAQGVMALAHGAMALAHGVMALAHGAMALAHGVMALAHGVMVLAQGVMALAQGVMALAYGAMALAQGVMALEHGVMALAYGAMALAQGVMALEHGVMTLEHIPVRLDRARPTSYLGDTPAVPVRTPKSLKDQQIVSAALPGSTAAQLAGAVPRPVSAPP